MLPIMLKAEANPGGLPMETFDGFREALAANRAQFFVDVPTGPFYGFNRPGAEVSQGVIDNWWRQGMMGAANAHYECIKAFSETDFTEDLKQIEHQEQQAQELRGLPARDAHRPRRRAEPRHPGVHRVVGPGPMGRYGSPVPPLPYAFLMSRARRRCSAVPQSWCRAIIWHEQLVNQSARAAPRCLSRG
ncbi:hypothetical protein Shyhy01_16900 [Streptomyces hygroscopicus subsp. hygroscopicus]|uniref:hypothetical protein n=1 Tax=Streptomyces sp. KHY 26 TaxID=3097359 RepID=UPI0024A26FB8|nr:hypothetical protein Shyhy01_16900 [Streptomyces hygroscopicus subsp. hygroscopicus]